MALVPKTANATASGVTDIVSETASYAIVVYGGTVHNADTANVEVGIRAGDAGSDFWHAVLGPNGQGSILGFNDAKGRGVELAVNTPLVVNLSNGSTYNVDVNVVYELKLIG